MRRTNWVDAQKGIRSAIQMATLIAWMTSVGMPGHSSSCWGEETKSSGGAVTGFLRAITRAVLPASDELTATVEIAPDESQSSASGESLGDIGTHRQTRRIDLIDNEAGLRLSSFCLNQQGQIVALLSKKGSVYPAVTAFQVPGAGSSKQSEIRVLTAQGELISQFDLDFDGSAVNVGPDGMIYVGGNGVVAKFSADGKEIARSDAPHLKALSQDDAALEARARETMAENIESLKQAMAQMEQQKKELSETPENELTDEQRNLRGIFDPTIEAYKQMISQYEDPEQQAEQLKQTMNSLASRQRTINAISVNDKFVFVTCAASKGYGYAVWRTDLAFENGQQIVDGLRGCCGQMDVQCCEDELIVAENARHRVVRFDAEGTETIKFGKRSRDGDGEGFGSCCNPMNTRLVGTQLYVAESDGTVKLFDRDGKFKEIVGRAKVEAGCKSSIVAADSSGDTVFYFDVTNSGICVLERQLENPDAQKALSDQAAVAP